MRLTQNQIIAEPFGFDSMLFKIIHQIIAPQMFFPRKGGQRNQFSQQFRRAMQVSSVHWIEID
jgi:hypothetical protein